MAQSNLEIMNELYMYFTYKRDAYLMTRDAEWRLVSCLPAGNERDKHKQAQVTARECARLCNEIMDILLSLAKEA